MPKDFYLVLGIASDATLADIKDAYRKLAKAYHPDHYGNNHSPFLAVQEAYSVLSDPIKRQAHDLAVRSQKRKIRPGYGKNIRTSSARQVEPLIPGQKKSMDVGTENFARSFHTHRLSFDELFNTISSSFRQTSRFKSEHLKNLNVVISLRPEQAFRGGTVEIALPAQRPCPSCSGRGSGGVYGCRRCGGDGVLSGEYPVMVRYPSGMSANHMVRVPLDNYGIQNLYLTVRFRISEMR